MASTSNSARRPVHLHEFVLSTSTSAESSVSSVQSSFMPSTSASTSASAESSVSSVQSNFMPSTSASAESTFAQYKPPTAKLPFESDKRYHVFLSFRGKDVRRTLVDHLYQALSAAGLNVFLDSDKLGKGEMIGLSLERAIESSVIRIPIFSRGYADSAWCLKEAAAMLNSPGLIIPLFYHVEPSHVRYPENSSSPYNRSFLKYHGLSDRYTGEEIGRWKKALRSICERSGWSVDTTGGFEARLVKTVVNDVIMTLDRVPLEVAKHPVGLDNIKNSLIEKLNLNSVNKVLKTGIWGMGGIGKTTAAKAVYNQIYADFEAASFVVNVRDTAAEVGGLTKLQKKVLKDLSKYGDEVDSVDEGIFLFRERLRRKRVLLILDDVDAVIQLNVLVGNWLAPGSRVIITSRDKHILNVAGISSNCIHEMSGLSINESLHLFSWHAFLRGSPSPTYKYLSKGIVEACKGHPLSLEVIGSFLYDKQDDIGCWKEAFNNIVLNPDIHERLKISYNALGDEEKEIFVDIACFFIGEHRSCPTVFWKSFYKMVDTAISNLSMKLLIKIDGKGNFEMHDHLRDMGQTIAEKEKAGSRLWEAAHVNSVSNNNFSRIRLNGGDPQRLKMLCRPGLRYLHLHNVPIKGLKEETLAVLAPSLVWLRLEHCPIAIGNKGPIKKILGLLKKKCHSRSMVVIRQLKIMQIMQLKDTKTIFISSLFALPNIHLLQHLNLDKCKSLDNVPDSIGNLSGLLYLNLRGCRRLISLPNTIGELSKLRHLNLEWCYRLNNLPHTIGNMSQLQQLELGGCDGLTSLPDTIGDLSQLEHLNLRGCYRLNNLPNTIGNLSQLQHLDLKWCYKLNYLPNTIGNLSKLVYLDLRGCRNLNNLPETINGLPQLLYFLC